MFRLRIFQRNLLRFDGARLRWIVAPSPPRSYQVPLAYNWHAPLQFVVAEEADSFVAPLVFVVVVVGGGAAAAID